MVAFEREWGLVEEHEGTFWGDGHAQDIGKGLSHKGVTTQQVFADSRALRWKFGTKRKRL